MISKIIYIYIYLFSTLQENLHQIQYTWKNVPVNQLAMRHNTVLKYLAILFQAKTLGKILRIC